MSTIPRPFALPDVRRAAFASKDDHLAFQAAWKALCRARAPLPPSFFVAHAVLTGRDLYKSFSASKRPHHRDRPYHSLLLALRDLTRLKYGLHYRRDILNDAQAAALHAGILRAISLVQPLKLNDAVTTEVIARGAGGFPQSAAALAAKVTDAQAVIMAANEACWRAQRAAEQARDVAQKPAETALASIKATYQARALELAIDDASCPRKRWGGHMEPDEVEVQPDGLRLSWNINGDYAPATFLATWETLLAAVPAKVTQA